jgi:general secretion pathway protein K
MKLSRKNIIQAHLLNNQSGIALLIVLWIMVLLITMVFSFSVMARTEIFSALNFKRQIENKYLAEAGLQCGIMELFYRAANKNKQVTFVEEEILRTDGTAYTGKLENGSYQYRITDESGKIDINALTDSSGIILNNLLVNLGIDKETADTIVDSILDWKSPTDLHRLHGADSSYYLSLSDPYKAKNANFDSLEELLLVKGVTSDILYGNEERPGVISFLTIQSKSGRININAAAPEVLKAIPFISDDAVQQIMNLRSANNTKTAADIQTSMADGDYSKMSPYITTADSNIFSIEVSGYKENEKNGYPLKAIVSIEDNGLYSVLSYQSPASIKR